MYYNIQTHNSIRLSVLLASFENECDFCVASSLLVLINSFWGKTNIIKIKISLSFSKKPEDIRISKFLKTEKVLKYYLYLKGESSTQKHSGLQRWLLLQSFKYKRSAHYQLFQNLVLLHFSKNSLINIKNKKKVLNKII